MARTLTPRDCHALINLVQKEIQGIETLKVVDSSTFVSAGEKILSAGTENVINALSLVLGRTLVATRPIQAKLAIINSISSGAYTSRLRKISYYAKSAVNDGWHNTQLFTNLKTGFTDGENPSGGTAQSTKSMWEQSAPEVLEMNFGGTSTWQYVVTMYENQLKLAFRNESEFASFIGGVLTEAGNDIEQEKESFNRVTLLNYIGGIVDMASVGTCINLTKRFNSKFGTNYTSAQLRTTYLKEFLKFFVETFKITSDFMTHRTSLYHWSPSKTDANGNSLTLLRHTPKSKQRMILFNPLFVQAEAEVLPEIFHDNYLKVEQGERVDYWQSVSDPAGVYVTPAIPNKANPNAQTAGDSVNIPYLVGVLYDEDAIMVDYQLETANVTPLEARKGYRNTWYTFSKNAINDFTENGIIFYMADDADDPVPSTYIDSVL